MKQITSTSLSFINSEVTFFFSILRENIQFHIQAGLQTIRALVVQETTQSCISKITLIQVSINPDITETKELLQISDTTTCWPFYVNHFYNQVLKNVLLLLKYIKSQCCSLINSKLCLIRFKVDHKCKNVQIKN